MSIHIIWLAISLLMCGMDAYEGYTDRQPANIVLALLWAFVAGLHFAKVLS